MKRKRELSELQRKEKTISIGDLKVGIYFVQIEEEIEKFIKQ